MGTAFSIAARNSNNVKTGDPKSIVTDTKSFVPQEWTKNFNSFLMIGI